MNEPIVYYTPEVEHAAGLLRHSQSDDVTEVAAKLQHLMNARRAGHEQVIARYEERRRLGRDRKLAEKIAVQQTAYQAELARTNTTEAAQAELYRWRLMIAEHTQLFNNSGVVEIFKDFEKLLKSQGEWDANVRILLPQVSQFTPEPKLQLSWDFRLSKYPYSWRWDYHSVQCFVTKSGDETKLFFPTDASLGFRGLMTDMDPLAITKTASDIIGNPYSHFQNDSFGEIRPPAKGIIRGLRHIRDRH